MTHLPSNLLINYLHGLLTKITWISRKYLIFISLLAKIYFHVCRPIFFKHISKCIHFFRWFWGWRCPIEVWKKRRWDLGVFGSVQVIKPVSWKTVKSTSNVNFSNIFKCRVIYWRELTTKKLKIGNFKVEPSVYIICSLPSNTQFIRKQNLWFHNSTRELP